MSLVRKEAPEFTAQAVVNGEFEAVTMSELKGQYVVLFFYPLDHTFVCPTEIIAFSDRAAEFEAINCKLLACSVDSKFSHRAWINAPRNEGGLGGVNFPIIADITKEISLDYGVLIDDADDEECGVALRGLFIIDGEGKVRCSNVNDLPVGRSVDETLRLVQAFQYTDEHGEVCPLGWTPGKRTINTNQHLDYFSAEFGEEGAAGASAEEPAGKRARK